MLKRQLLDKLFDTLIIVLYGHATWKKYGILNEEDQVVTLFSLIELTITVSLKNIYYISISYIHS